MTSHHHLSQRTVRRRRTRPASWTVGGGLGFAVCAWLLLLQWGFDPLAQPGRATASRAVLVALAVAPASLRTIMGPHRLAAAVMGCGAAVLVSSAALFHHVSPVTALGELTSGLLLLTATAFAARRALPAHLRRGHR